MATVVNKTIAASGGDYVSLAALAADTQDLVLADEQWEVTCENFEDSAGTATFTGWNTDATRFLRIKAADAHVSGGIPTTNAYRHVVSTGNNVTLNDVGTGGLVIFEGIQFDNSGTGTNLSPNDADSTFRFIKCIVHNSSSGNPVNIQTGTTQWINCTFIGGSTAFVRNAGDCSVYNCTARARNAAQLGYNMGLNNATRKCVNTYAAAAGNDYNGSGITKTNAASSDTTGDPAGLQNIAFDTSNFVNVTSGSEDVHLVAGSPLIDAGTDRSAESDPFDYTDDLDGDTRDANDDVGADEFIPPPVHTSPDDLTINQIYITGIADGLRQVGDGLMARGNAPASPDIHDWLGGAG